MAAGCQRLIQTPIIATLINSEYIVEDILMSTIAIPPIKSEYAWKFEYFSFPRKSTNGPLIAFEKKVEK